MEHPTYYQICTGTTGHAEVIQITFDADVISYAEILEVFWRTHDPTTLNRQEPMLDRSIALSSFITTTNNTPLRSKSSVTWRPQGCGGVRLSRRLCL